MSADGAGNYNVGEIAAAGNGYQIGDTVTISGTSLGGVDGINDLSLTVTALTSTVCSPIILNRLRKRAILT